MITTDYLTVSPAYGRDYKSAKEAQEAFLSGKDFVMDSPGQGGTYCSVRDFAPGTIVEVRFNKKEKLLFVEVPAK